MNNGFVAEFDAYRHLGWYFCEWVSSCNSSCTAGEKYVRGQLKEMFGRGVVVDSPEKVEAFAKEQAEIFLSNHPRTKPVKVEYVDRWGTQGLSIGGEWVIIFKSLISVYLSHNVTYKSDDSGEMQWVMLPMKKGGKA